MKKSIHILLIGLGAMACHTVNRALCEAMGDASQAAWDDAPDWQKESAELGVEKMLSNPNMTPEQLHESWCEQKLADGWKYGPEKNAETKEHHCLVPYADLPVEQRAKDYVFRAVVTVVKELADAAESYEAEHLSAKRCDKSCSGNAVAAGIPVGFVGVKYTGRRPSFTDHLYGTGLSFEAGQVRFMEFSTAQNFLRHPDVFARVEPTADSKADADTQAALDVNKREQEQQDSKENNLAELHQAVGLMKSKKALSDFAKSNYNIELDSSKKLDEMKAEARVLIDRFGAVV